MTPNELMDKICDEADAQSQFYKDINEAGDSRDKLKYITLLIEHFHCDFDCARAVADWAFDGIPLPSDLSPAEIARVNREAQEALNKPKCPICGSMNLTKISTVGKVAKVGFFGIFGAGDIGKTWKCNNCRSKF